MESPDSIHGFPGTGWMVNVPGKPLNLAGKSMVSFRCCLQLTQWLTSAPETPEGLRVSSTSLCTPSGVRGAKKTCLPGFGGNWNSVGQSAKVFESNPFKSCVSMQTLGAEKSGTHVCHCVLPFSGWFWPSHFFWGIPDHHQLRIIIGDFQRWTEVWARKVRSASRVPARGPPRFFEAESVGFVQHAMRVLVG